MEINKPHSVDHLNTKLIKLVEFLTPFLPLANSHLVQFISEDQWNKYLPTGLQQDLLQVHLTNLNLVATAELYELPTDFLSEDSGNFSSLQNFLTTVRSLHAHNLNILSRLSKIESDIDEQDDKILESSMNQKKAYEVKQMSRLIANICKDKEPDWIVDIGSGLGYLSSTLLIQHKLKVFALDASVSNISSCLKQSKILFERFRNTHPSTVRNQRKNRNSESLKLKDEKRPLGFIAFEGRFLGLTKYITDNENLNEHIYSLLTDYKKSSDKLEVCDLDTLEICDLEESEIVKLDNSEINDINKSEICDLEKLKLCDLKELKNLNLGVVGLHTCGNLSSTSLKLFLNNSTAQFMCNVGCCYHLLVEKFCEDIYINNQKVDDSRRLLDGRYHCPELDPFHRRNGSESVDEGFPLCSYLRSIKFSLGRNARDLAAKPSNKLAVDDKNLRSLFWRALFEQFVTEIYGKCPEDARVGRKLNKGCPSFYHYCQKCLNSIGLNNKLSEEEICLYYEKYKWMEDQMIRFLFLKSSVAPLIETLINLDRLIYLQEQGVGNSHLIQVFDSTISPRNFALIAFK